MVSLDARLDKSLLVEPPQEDKLRPVLRATRSLDGSNVAMPSQTDTSPISTTENEISVYKTKTCD